MTMVLVTGAVMVASLVSLAGCSRGIELLPPRDAGANTDVTPTSDGTRSCSGLGPAIQLERDQVAQCAGALGALSQRFALCVCSNLSLEQPFRSDAFDSTGLTAADNTTAAVGITGQLSCDATVAVGGAVQASGTSGVAASASLDIAESLRVAGPLVVQGAEAEIRADAYVAGGVSGDVMVAGTLHLPSGFPIDSMVPSGALVREPVDVPDPCDCSSSIVDVGRAVSSARTANDNLSISLSMDALTGSGAPGVLDLPCGMFFLSAIDVTSDVTLNVHGRAGLAVMGDVSIAGAFDVSLDAGAELDLIVGGKLAISGGRTFGSNVAPARFRVWTATTETVLLEQAPTVGAVIYAPRAQVTAPSGVDIYGSLRAMAFSSEGPTVVHYDRAILSAGVSCGFPAQPAVH
jgi:hypothetical protein